MYTDGMNVYTPQKWNQKKKNTVRQKRRTDFILAIYTSKENVCICSS
jgi:hypothetical protein